MPESSDCGLVEVGKSEIQSARKRFSNDVRIRFCIYSGGSLEDDDAVGEVCCHDEIVLNDEGGLFGMKDEAEVNRISKWQKTLHQMIVHTV